MIARIDIAHYLAMIPVQLEYTAPAGCPTQAEFVAFVASRGGDFANPGPNTKARTMTVTLKRDGSEHRGALELRLDDMATDARQLRAETCAEVAEALAVVAAIALRGPDAAPEATPSRPQPTGPTQTSAPAQSPSSTLVGPPPAKALPAPAPPPHDTRLRTIGGWADAEVPVTAGSLQIKRSFMGTLSGGLVLGAIPDLLLPRYDFTWTRTNFITTPQGNNFLIGNVFGGQWSFLGIATRKDGSYSTEMWGFRAGLVSCSSLSYDSAGLVALLCGNIAIGMMNLETKDSESDYTQEKRAGFGTVSIDLDLRYHFASSLHLGAVVGGEVWVSEMTAERADGSQLFKARIPSVHAQLGIGATF